MLVIEYTLLGLGEGGWRGGGTRARGWITQQFSVINPDSRGVSHSALCLRDMMLSRAAAILCLKVVTYAISMLGALHCIFVCVSYSLALSHRRLRVCPLDDRLCGQMVKASSSVMADTGFESRFLPGDFSGSSNTSDLNIGTPVANCQVLGL